MTTWIGNKPAPQTWTVRRWAARCSLVILGLLSGLVLIELGLRGFGLGAPFPTISHPCRGRAYRPGAVFDYSGEGLHQFIRFNRDGFRDTDRSPAKPHDVYRIAILGDSYIEAPQVAIADRVTEQLEAELNRRGVFAPRMVEVLNFGVSTYGTMQELQTLKHEVWRFQPDLIILAFLTGNDFENNCRDLAPDEHEGPHLDFRNGEFREVFPQPKVSALVGAAGHSWDWPRLRLMGLWDKFRYVRFMNAKRQAEANRYRTPDAPGAWGFEAGLDVGIYHPPTEAAWVTAWEVTEELLRRFDRERRAHGTDWLLLVLSNGIQVHPDLEVRERFRCAMGHSTLFYAEEHLTEAAQRDGYEIFCLAPPLGEIAKGDQVLLHGFENMQPGFGHWNERGHRAAAELIADHLHGKVPKSGSAVAE